MSDNNANRKAVTRQTNASYYELARAHLGQGFHNSVNKAGQLPVPESKGAAAVFAARTAIAGVKQYGKSAYHAGMGMMQAFMQQNPNDGRQLNNIIISQSLEQGRIQQSKVNQAKQYKQNTQYKSTGKITSQQKLNQSEANRGIESARNKISNGQRNAVQSNQNKGIESMRNKAINNSQNTNAGKSTNQGIRSYQSKASGTSASAGKSSGSGQGW